MLMGINRQDTSATGAVQQAGAPRYIVGAAHPMCSPPSPSPSPLRSGFLGVFRGF